MEPPSTWVGLRGRAPRGLRFERRREDVGPARPAAAAAGGARAPRLRRDRRAARRGSGVASARERKLGAAGAPCGELLTAPSADRLEVVGCLLDGEDDVRLERLGVRGSVWLERTGLNLPDLLAWAEWMRWHARDPRHRQHVIRGAGDPSMRWERCTELRAGDPRWRMRVVDTTSQAVAAVADACSRGSRTSGRRPPGRSGQVLRGRDPGTGPWPRPERTVAARTRSAPVRRASLWKHRRGPCAETAHDRAPPCLFQPCPGDRPLDTARTGAA